jgi:hypothetical protein
MITGLEGNAHFNVHIELLKDRNHPVKLKSPEPRVADARKLRMRDAG